MQNDALVNFAANQLTWQQKHNAAGVNHVFFTEKVTTRYEGQYKRAALSFELPGANTAACSHSPYICKGYM